MWVRLIPDRIKIDSEPAPMLVVLSFNYSHEFLENSAKVEKRTELVDSNPPRNVQVSPNSTGLAAQ